VPTGGIVPTYAYACTACEHRFEITQSFTEDSLTECPQCQGRLRKIFNAVGVVFKGSGFYSNDSRSDSRRNKGAGGSSGKSGGHSRSESGSTGSSTPSGESGSASSHPSSSTSSDSSASNGTTKTATKPTSKSEGSAA
jgi:putative FmdB family regulatory protein